MSNQNNHARAMTDKQKSFWSGTIVTAIVVGMTGLLTWGLLQAAHVPVVEAKSDEQFRSLNRNMENLVITGDRTNTKIQALTTQLSEFSKLLLVTQIELKQVKEDCDNNTEIIQENKHNHKYDFENRKVQEKG